MALKLKNFHVNMGPAIGLPFMSMQHPSEHSSVFGGIGDFGSTMRGIFDPFDLFGAAKDLTHDIVRAPVEIAHEASTAFTGVAHEVAGVAGSLEKAASSILSSPMVLIGGAAVLLILLSR
jgi:hypothetical protein